MSNVRECPYTEFLESRRQANDMNGFTPTFMPDYLFGFQKAIVDWAIRKGRAAIFADCGLGKSIMELVWGLNVCDHTTGRVLLITPIAVGAQMIEEAEKFGLTGVSRSRDGSGLNRITITNYERLHYFDPADFTGIILDESSILKNFNGATRHKLNIFMRKIPYRLLATATAAPNDFIELGTSSEALGYLGYMDMLTKFFKNDQNNCATKRRGRFMAETKWRLKGHAHDSFWRWVTSWARAIRRPSDIGFEDNGFLLPTLTENEHELDLSRPPSDGELFTFPANNLKEVRDERRATITGRCEFIASRLHNHEGHAVVWCNLNDEGDLLERLIPGAIQVSGKDDDDAKEAKLIAFTHGDEQILITKPKIGAWGLNWQHCRRIAYCLSYSYEQYYQAVRRCWRFGQREEVAVDLVYTRGDRHTIATLRRKQQQADEMFTKLVNEINNSLNIQSGTSFDRAVEVPSWLSKNQSSPTTTRSISAIA